MSDPLRKGSGLGIGGEVLSTGSSLKASQVTLWPRLRISNSLLTLCGEESQPCKVDEEIQHVIMSVEILCKLDRNMHTYASCRLWLLDTNLRLRVQMRGLSGEQWASSLHVVWTSPLCRLVCSFLSSSPQATGADLYLPQGVSWAWVASEVASCHRSVCQDGTLKCMSLVNHCDLALDRRWDGPWQGMRWPSEFYLVHLGHCFLEGGPQPGLLGN